MAASHIPINLYCDEAETTSYFLCAFAQPASTLRAGNELRLHPIMLWKKVAVRPDRQRN